MNFMLLCMLAQKNPVFANGYVWANFVSTCICHVTWSFTGPLHVTIPFQFPFGFYSKIYLIPTCQDGFCNSLGTLLSISLDFLHSMIIFFTFTWNFKMALDPPQFIIGFVLSLGIHLKLHLTTRSYNVILTSTLAFHLNFHLIPVVDLVIHLSSSHDISCAQWFLRSQGSQDVPDAEGMPSVCFTFSFPQNMNAKEGTSPVKPVETLVQTYVLSFFSL